MKTETAREPKKFAAENGSGKSSASIEVPPSFDLKSPLPVPFRAAFAPSAPGHPRRPFLWRTRAEPRRERVARRRGGVGAASEHRGERDGDEDELGGGGSHGARGGEGRGGRRAACCAARRTMFNAKKDVEPPIFIKRHLTRV